MTDALLWTAGAYGGAIAVLTLLVLVSTLRTWIKLFALLLAVALIPLSLRSAGVLRGTPAPGPPPGSFELIWARVVEPSQVARDPGAVYLWVQPLDPDGFPVGLPRSYGLPYSENLVRKAEKADAEIASGERVQGEILDEEALEDTTLRSLSRQITDRRDAAKGGYAGERFTVFDPDSLEFGVRAAPETPEKPK